MAVLRSFAVSFASVAKFRSSHQRCSLKKLFLKISQHPQENTCAGVKSAVFLINLQAFRQQFKIKIENSSSCFNFPKSKTLDVVQVSLIYNICERFHLKVALSAQTALTKPSIESLVLLETWLHRASFPGKFYKCLEQVYKVFGNSCACSD